MVARVTSNEPFIFTVDFEATSGRTLLNIELACDGRVGRRSQVNHMPTFVVSSGREMLTIGRDGERELILKRICFQQVGQIALEVVRDMCGVDGLHGAGRVDDHACGRVGAFSDVPEFGAQVVSTQNEVFRVRHKACIADYLKPLVEDSRSQCRLSLGRVEFDRRLHMKVGRLAQVADADVTL